MRKPLVVVVAVLLAACAADGTSPGAARPSRGANGDGGGHVAVGGALSAAVFPFDGPPGTFLSSQRGEVAVRLEPFEGGAAMWITGDGLSARRIDWHAEGGSIYCSDGPDRSIEFLRLGAAPGTAWKSSGRVIRFDGWERVETPAGLFDAARISSTLEVEPYAEVETWWFAPGLGLIQMRVDKGDLYSMEMQRTR